MPVIPFVTAVASTAIGFSQKAKAEKNAKAFAEQQAKEAKAEQQRIEEKFGLSPGELERQDRAFSLEKERQTELSRRAGLSGESLLREQGDTTSKLLDLIQGRLGQNGEDLFLSETGGIGRQLIDEIGGSNEDLFKQELDLALQGVNQQANRRGVFGGLPEGGIRFEQLGRAGVDLAIKSARERLDQQNVLLNTYLTLKSGARGDAGTVSERALTSKERASSELAQFLQDLQQQSAASKGRAASAGINAAQIAQPSVAQSYQDLQGIAGFRGGIVGPGEVGLSAIGDIGSQLLFQKLIAPTPKPTSSSSSYEEFLRSSAETSPRQRLRDITGSELEDELYRLRR